MCRFVVYAGLHPLMLADLVVRPSHSITKQSFDSRMLLNRSNLNGDGFGIGWYKGPSFAHCFGDSPCVFTSATPAWNSANLRRIAEKISSPLVFAHVRAATPGFPVGETECHPFTYGPFMWMHNGNLAHFPKFKRRIQQSLSDEIYNAIHGGTDSEHCFATFLNMIEDPLSFRERSVDELRGHVLATIRLLSKWSAEAGAQQPGGCQPSLLNFAVTDGRMVIVTRYATGGHRPASLYYASGTRFESISGDFRVVQADRRQQLVMVASEPLTGDEIDWLPVPINHLLIITPALNVLLYPIDIEP
eukprot:tig00021017_g17195.t1